MNTMLLSLQNKTVANITKVKTTGIILQGIPIQLRE